MTFVAPDIQWVSLVPLLIILGAAVIGVLVEAFVPRGPRRLTQVVLSIVAVSAALVAVVWRYTVVLSSGPSTVFEDSFKEDGPALIAQMILLVIGFISLLVIADRSETGDGAFVASAATRPGSEEESDATEAGLVQSEVYPLVLFSMLGMMVFTGASSLVTLFVALEVLSLPLYVLTGMARRRRLLSQEASLKYFLLGAFSSALMLFGITMLYGYSGTFSYSGIHSAAPTMVGMDALLFGGTILVLIGLLFKVGAAPFHAWTPDVYQGAPTPITGFMAAATKLAAFAAMLRLVYVALPGTAWDIAPVMWVIIGLTMAAGTFVGIVQSNVKRMLAYSSVAHAGFVLLGVFSMTVSATPSVLFYLLAYGIATVGAFGIVTLVREKDPNGFVTGEALELKQWAGLGKRSPLLAAAMTIFLLSFAGIPLTAGFVGKLTVFISAVQGGMWPLVVLAVLFSAATAYFYVRLIILMYFTEPEGEETVVVESEGLTSVAIGVAALVTVLLGVFPGPVLDFISQAAAYLP
ncbi:NADH dehydrogenase subunit N [Ruaniaceae bacterium KH17]|nr:NADH dehydrogenase subunit N [Ruaniaceae bacterium KH17]